MRRGFTLVELLVALAVGSIVSVIVYGLFDTTSDSLAEVESLSESTDRLRFALERVRVDMQSAGSLSTPDSALDPDVIQPLATVRVQGVVPYTGWQNGASAFATGVRAANNDLVSHDGFIVMGAIEMPQSMEVSNIRVGEPNSPQIRPTVRGAQRLGMVDPFSVSLCTSNMDCASGIVCLNGSCVAPTVATDPVGTYLDGTWATRLLRLYDRQGKIQFVGLGPASNSAGSVAFGWVAPNPVFKGGSNFDGLDPSPDGDVSYEGAFVDAFWYHVIPNPIDPTNMMLVRERLCARALATSTLGTDPATLLPSLTSNCGENETVVIADRVADFQVWFDCTTLNSATGVAIPSPNTLNWLQLEGGTCMPATIGTETRPGLIRRAHIRLSMYTQNERKDLRNYQFENVAGQTRLDTPAILDAANDPTLRLRTFDMLPDLDGAASVVTLQTSFEMPNFAYRNLR